MKLKLNYKRTCLIGFAFFGILLLWQVYDSWCPTFLTDIFARKMYGFTSAELKTSDPEKILNVQWIVGIIMACDNLVALLLLPIFGRLSDRTKSPIGKRMPYILVGTGVVALVFPLLPLFFHYNNIVCMVIVMAIVLIFMMMYRNPAVALMPDITPKPLRARANGIINIMGFSGAAVATVLGIFLKLSDYINVADRAGKVWIIEIPFIVASVLMVISALVLFATIKENRLEEELADEMEEGERQAAILDPVTDGGPMSNANKKMLISILLAEFLWFMSDNAISTYLGNYVMYYLNSESSNTMLILIVTGIASIVGFAISGPISEKIGRKNTISTGLIISAVALFGLTLIKPTGVITGDYGEYAISGFIYFVCLLKGFGMALVHNCSFPMVVELCSKDEIGKFTGYYYMSSMSAQTITPILLGFILTKTSHWGVLPIYSTVLTGASCIVFILLVNNIKPRRLLYDDFCDRYYAHRGLFDNIAVPENSLPALKAANESGYGIELDVRLTKDGKLVVFHDDDLLRMCGNEAPVEDVLYKDLKELKLLGTDEGIPMLSDALEMIAEPVIVEIKPCKKRRELCRKTYEALKKYNGKYAIESFDPRIVAWFMWHAPQVVRGVLATTEDKLSGNVNSKLKARLLANCHFNFLANPDFIAYSIGERPKRIEKLRKRGKMIFAWTSVSENDTQANENDSIIFENYRPQPIIKRP